ncbi:hypothetical protein Tco_0601260 [Tanacetum coccineum]
MKRVNSFIPMNSEMEISKKDRTDKEHEISSKRVGDDLKTSVPKKQKIDELIETKKNVEVEVDDYVELKNCLEIVPEDEDDVIVDATPLSSRSPSIVDYKIHKEGKKKYFQIIRADVPVDDMDNLLLRTLSTMFKPQVEDTIWTYQQGLTKVKNWKLYDSCGVYCITMQNIVYYLLVEKTYPLTRNTLYQLWNNVRLQVDYEVEMAYELLRNLKIQKMNIKFRGGLLGSKGFIRVSAAQCKVTTVSRNNAASLRVTTADKVTTAKKIMLTEKIRDISEMR